jgi:hypothetical protein
LAKVWRSFQKARCADNGQNDIRRGLFDVKGKRAIALEPEKANQRGAFNGLCLAIIQSGREPGGIRIQAELAGLNSAEVKVEVR